jgi:hypothetical protein
MQMLASRVLMVHEPELDEELPELPPLDGDDTQGVAFDDEYEIAVDDSASLDDQLSNEHTFEEIDDITNATGDDQEGIDGDADDNDIVDTLDDGRWSGEEEREVGEASDVDELSELPPDDDGFDGTSEDPAAQLGELPPIDDDGDEDGPIDNSARETSPYAV